MISIMENGYAYESTEACTSTSGSLPRPMIMGLSGRRIDELQNQTRALDGQDEKQDPRLRPLEESRRQPLMRWPSP